MYINYNYIRGCIIGCNCGKSVRGTSGRSLRGSGQPQGASSNGASPQQLQALLRKQAEREGNQKNSFEERRIQKLRRDAIKKALGR